MAAREPAQPLDVGGAERAVPDQEESEIPVPEDGDVSLGIALPERGEPGDRDLERADDLDRRIAIPAADGERAARGQMSQIVGHCLLGVEVTLGQGVRAARECREAIDHGHDDQVVTIGGTAHEAARLVLDQVDTRVRIDLAAVFGVTPAHQRDDRAVDLDRGDRPRAVSERRHHVDAPAGTDDEHVRARGQLIRRPEDARVEDREVAGRAHPDDRRERSHVELHGKRRRA